MCISEEREITLEHIFQLIETNIDAKSLCWSILFLGINGCHDYNMSITEFEESIHTTKGGYKLKWEELKCLCSKFGQIIDCSLIGCKSNEEIDYVTEVCKGDNFHAVFNMSYVGIDINDGSMWGFYSKNKQLEEVVHNAIGPFPCGYIYGIYNKIEKSTALIDLLRLMEKYSDVESLYWSILDLHVIGELGFNISGYELEETVRNTEGGYKLNWGKLKDLCGKFKDIINCFIVGYEKYEDIYSIAAMSKKDFSSAFNMSYVGIGVLNGLLRDFSSKDKQLEEIIRNNIGPFPCGIYGIDNESGN